MGECCVNAMNVSIRSASAVSVNAVSVSAVSVRLGLIRALNVSGHWG